MSGGEHVVLDVLLVLARTAPDVVEVVTGLRVRDLQERIARARGAISDPIDTREDDAARRRRLEDAVRGLR